MAEQEPQGEGLLTKAAKTVGTALGTVASAASEMAGGKDEKTQPAGKRKSATANPAQVRARERMKAKRAKHRRKLHRKTKG